MHFRCSLRGDRTPRLPAWQRPLRRGSSGRGTERAAPGQRRGSPAAFEAGRRRGRTTEQSSDKSQGRKGRGFWKSAVICSGAKSRLSPLPGGSLSSGKRPPIPGAARGQDPCAAAAEEQRARPGPARPGRWPRSPPQRPSGTRRGRSCPAAPLPAPGWAFLREPSVPRGERVTVCPKPSLLGSSRKQGQGRKEGLTYQAREGTPAHRPTVSEHGFPGFRLLPAVCAATHRTLLSP
ncbi:uncharacterized protein LJ206_004529 isoform 1-T8 [Theristicus caerulescens]